MTPTSRRRSALSASVLVPALAALFMGFPATAQTANEVRALVDRVETLERDLNGVQRQLYRGGGGDVGGGAAPSGSAAAAQEVRLSGIEDQMRQLNGRVEEVGFQARQLAERLDKMQQDLEFRLQALERGAGIAPAAPLADAGTSPTAQGAAQGAALGAAAPPASGPGAPPKPLGQLGGNTPLPLPPPAPPAGAAAQAEDDLPTTVIGGSPKDQYEQARARILQKDYPGAAAGLEAFIKAYPEDPLAGSAQYWLGESHYAQGHFDAAAAAFLTGLKKYPKSPKAPDSMLKLGMTLGEMGQKKEACAALGDIPNRYPNASLAIKQRAQKERQRVGCS